MSRFLRDTQCTDFYSAYQELNERDKEEFSRVCNKLLNENYIYGQIKEDRADYLQILSLQKVITHYFELIDYTLSCNSSYKIFFLKSNIERNRLKLKKMESVLILLCRKIYYIKSKETDSSINIRAAFDELLDEINKTHIYNKRLNKTDLLDALKVLRRYKIIDFDYNRFSAISAFEIYPTILFVVTDEDLKLIENKLMSYKGSTNEGEDNETDEDPVD